MSKRSLRQRAVSSNPEIQCAHSETHVQTKKASVIGARVQYMPTEGQAAEAQRVLTKHAFQLEDIDKNIKALIVDRNQQVQSIVEETGLEIKRL